MSAVHTNKMENNVARTRKS